jgi:hypothetical protein
MYLKLTDDEQTLFEEGVVLSTNQLVLSKILVNPEEDERYMFSTDLYATINPQSVEKGYLHFRIFDGTSEDFDPALSFNDRKIAEIILPFEQQEGDNEELYFSYNTQNGARLIFIDGESQEFRTLSGLDGLSLIIASKLFFINIIRVLESAEH